MSVSPTTFSVKYPVLNRFALAALMIGMIGCDSGGPALYPVSGNVTFQGEPVGQGQISFVPDTQELGGGPAYYFSIENGKYAGKVTAGPKKVGISATRPTDKFQVDEDGNQMPVMESFIPDRYNELTILTVKIQQTANQGLDFQLE